jgi:hypothetical protein
VHENVRLQLTQQLAHALAIADVQLVVLEPWNRFGEALLVPACIALWTEKTGPEVIIEPMHLETSLPKKEANFRANQPR